MPSALGADLEGSLSQVTQPTGRVGEAGEQAMPSYFARKVGRLRESYRQPQHFQTRANLRFPRAPSGDVERIEPSDDIRHATFAAGFTLAAPQGRDGPAKCFGKLRLLHRLPEDSAVHEQIP